MIQGMEGRNSKYFVQAVLEARKLCPSSNRLAIFAGACQSFYEAIMEAGADFASSPGRILIDFIDPIIVQNIIYIKTFFRDGIKVTFGHELIVCIFHCNGADI